MHKFRQFVREWLGWPETFLFYLRATFWFVMVGLALAVLRLSLYF